jgi:hypothetical protein
MFRPVIQVPIVDGPRDDTKHREGGDAHNHAKVAAVTATTQTTPTSAAAAAAASGLPAPSKTASVGTDTSDHGTDEKQKSLALVAALAGSSGSSGTSTTGASSSSSSAVGSEAKAGTGSQMKQWKCEACTMMNSPLFIRCDTCSTPMPGAPVASSHTVLVGQHNTHTTTPMIE